MSRKKEKEVIEKGGKRLYRDRNIQNLTVNKNNPLNITIMALLLILLGIGLIRVAAACFKAFLGLLSVAFIIFLIIAMGL